MKILFLGTGSSYPSPSRGASSLIFQLNSGKSWIVDAGEGTQIQLQKSPFNVSRKKIEKIFITHLHGDHMFGLPGLLCTISTQIFPSTKESLNDPPQILDIYGPVGLRSFIATSLSLSCSLLCFNYRVHELQPVEVQYPEDWSSWDLSYSSIQAKHPNEIEGRIIKAQEKDGQFHWDLYEDQSFIIQAGLIHHRIPCFGYVFKEKDKPGALLVEKLKCLGLPKGPVYGKLKNGHSVQLDSGELIKSEDVVGPPVAGKTIVICGDTSDASALKSIVNSKCDVLIHEATHDDSLSEKAKEFGHSTPTQAAQTALEFQAKVLLLNHFSQRYSNDQGEESVKLLEEQARTTLNNSEMVLHCAHDFFVYEF